MVALDRDNVAEPSPFGTKKGNIYRLYTDTYIHGRKVTNSQFSLFLDLLREHFRLGELVASAQF